MFLRVCINRRATAASRWKRRGTHRRNDASDTLVRERSLEEQANDAISPGSLRLPPPSLRIDSPPLLYATRILLPSAFCLLPSAFCLLPSAFCLLPSAFCLLPSAFCLLPSAFCLLPASPLRIRLRIPSSHPASRNITSPRPGADSTSRATARATPRRCTTTGKPRWSASSASGLAPGACAARCGWAGSAASGRRGGASGR